MYSKVRSTYFLGTFPVQQTLYLTCWLDLHFKWLKILYTINCPFDTIDNYKRFTLQSSLPNIRLNQQPRAKLSTLSRLPPSFKLTTPSSPTLTPKSWQIPTLSFLL